MLLQLYQANRKLVPFDTSINEPLLAGNDVKPVQSRQAWRKFVTFDVLRSGNDVRPVQLRQVPLKLVPFDVLSSGNNVKPVQLRQAS